jgi:hypothetical protein
LEKEILKVKGVYIIDVENSSNKWWWIWCSRT